jgi:hypothetical protein
MSADRVTEALGLERVEHEVNALGFAPLKRGKYGIDLMRQHRDEHEVVTGLLVEFFSDAQVDTLVRRSHDAAFTLKLSET